MNSLQNFRQNYRAQSHQKFNDDTLHHKRKKTKQTQNKVANKRGYKKSYDSKSDNEMAIDRSEIAATYQVRSSHGISILFHGGAGSSGRIRHKCLIYKRLGCNSLAKQGLWPNFVKGGVHICTHFPCTFEHQNLPKLTSWAARELTTDLPMI